MVSGIHESIKSAFNDPRNGWQETDSAHVYCIRHIKQNFMRTIMDGDLNDVVNNMGHALNVSLFDYYRGVIQKANQRALD